MNVHCEFVRDHLSAFVDRELAADVTAAVQAHLAECEQCWQLVTQTQKIDQLARGASATKDSLPAWEPFASRLTANGTAQLPAVDERNQEKDLAKSANSNGISWTLIASLAVATAASIFLMITLMLPRSPTQAPTTHLPGEYSTQAYLELQPVVERFRVDPRTALDALRSQYELIEYSLTQADANLGRPTFVSHVKQTAGLPGNASPISTVVLSFPSCQCPFGECTCGEGGCNCIAIVCQRPDGSVYLVFEQCRSQTVDFGDLPVQRVWREGKEMQLVMVEDFCAVTIDWETGKVIVIGLRDDEEIAKLAASR